MLIRYHPIFGMFFLSEELPGKKGIIHLVNAIKYIDPKAGVVLCAGAPDTPEIAREMEDKSCGSKRINPNVVLDSTGFFRNRRSSSSTVTRKCSAVHRYTSRSVS